MGASIANAGFVRSVAFPARSKILLCKRKFPRFFPHGFRGETYLDWERNYKWRAHQDWQWALNRNAYQRKLSQGKQNCDLCDQRPRSPKRWHDLVLMGLDLPLFLVNFFLTSASTRQLSSIML